MNEILEIINCKTDLQAKEKIVELVEFGDIDILEFAKIRKLFDKSTTIKGKEFESWFRECVLDEVRKGHNTSGLYEFKEIESAVRYDFSNDPIHVKIKNQIEELNFVRKERESFLASIPERKINSGPNATQIDPDTGEEIELHRPIRTSTTTFKMMLKK